MKDSWQTYTQIDENHFMIKNAKEEKGTPVIEESSSSESDWSFMFIVANVNDLFKICSSSNVFMDFLTDIYKRGV